MLYLLLVKFFLLYCVACQTHMGKKRNRDKVQVKVTDVATDNSVYDMDAEELPCTPSKSPPGKKGKVKMNIDEKIAVINAVAELTSKCDGTFQKVESMEKILENTAYSITTLSTTISEKNCSKKIAS